jgi:hypothetical protein
VAFVIVCVRLARIFVSLKEKHPEFIEGFRGVFALIALMEHYKNSFFNRVANEE